ncbi:hypothetical protein DCCM_0554 [Desulfocucumis palustris]|uniref:Uncharacterized protein n=1 Tax=Desulfocucumis palustris TaxID=1898651 RepID=A0A2L2X8M6_9FIRM|nr:hypothetical protein DCCM_0554 [Desulfocucumis palustris]
MVLQTASGPDCRVSGNARDKSAREARPAGRERPYHLVQETSSSVNSIFSL